MFGYSPCIRLAGRARIEEQGRDCRMQSKTGVASTPAMSPERKNKTPKPDFMRKTILSATLFTCLLGISFTAQALTPDEETFIKKAATSDQAEITLSQLAVKRASSPEVKQFAQRMVTALIEPLPHIAVKPLKGFPRLSKPIVGPHEVNFSTQTDCGDPRHKFA